MHFENYFPLGFRELTPLEPPQFPSFCALTHRNIAPGETLMDDAETRVFILKGVTP